MPWRSRLIASTRSSRSAVSVVCWVSISRSSSSARRLTAPSRSRSRRSRSSSASIDGDVRQRGVRLDAGERRDAVGLDLEHLADFVGDVGEPALGAFDALGSARAASSRAAPSASSAARTARSQAPSAFSASASRSAASRRVASAASISPISARRFSAKAAGASASDARSCLASALRVSSVAICATGAVAALAPGLPVGGDGGEPAVGELGLARQRLRLGAHFGELRALAFDLGADVGELAFQVGRRRQLGERALGSVAARPAPRRGRRPAGSWPRSAPRCARRCAPSRARPWRAVRGRCRPRAARVRQCSRAAASAAPAAVSVRLRGLGGLALVSSVGAGG